VSSGEKVRLGDVITIEKADAPQGESVWMLNLDAVEKNTGRMLEKAMVAPSEVGTSTVPFSSKAVLFSKLRPNLNKVVMPDESGFATSEMLPLVADSNVLDRRYLAAFLRSRVFVNYAVASTAGAKMPRVSKKTVLDAKIRLPEFHAQVKRAGTFSALESQIETVEQQIAQLDQLVKSRFVEMFGDLSSYESKALKDCVLRIESGKSPKCLTTPREGDGPAVLKLSAISSGTYKETENKALPLDTKIIEEKVVCSGDILLSRKNTPELVGRSVLVSHTNGNIMFPDIVFRMHARSEINAAYLSHALAYPLFGSIRALAHGSAKSMSNIPKSELAELAVPLPPLALQQDFAAFAAQVDKTRAIAQQQIDKLQTLYDSLAQEYFA